MSMDLPRLALSVRQPWAWAIIHAGKDVENRSAGAIKWMRPLLGSAGGPTRRVAIHAAKGMTRAEYEDAALAMLRIGVTAPAACALLRGGIIGSVVVSGLVDSRTGDGSPWWMGGHGLRLRDPEPCPFRPAVGALGLFEWTASGISNVPQPAKWMLPRAAEPPAAPESSDLFGVCK